MDAHRFFADKARAASREVDFGVWWRSSTEPKATYRVSYIEATGELYAITFNATTRSASGKRVMVESPLTGTVTLFATDLEEEVVERLLLGWAEVCGQPGSLDWVANRLKCAECAEPWDHRRHLPEYSDEHFWHNWRPA